jgi:hypothetical protein
MLGVFMNELINSNNSMIDSLIAPTHLLKKVNQSVVTRHTYFNLFQQVTLDMQSALFKQKLVQRLAQIESVMNKLKNYHGLAKARFRGIHNVQIQAYMAAIAINIKRIVFLFFINGLMLLKCKQPFATGRTLF